MPLPPEQLTAVAGIVLSLAANYIPGFAPWFDQLTPTPKRLLMLAALLLATAGVFGWQCRADLPLCLAAGWEDYLGAFITALVANQSAASILPLPAERRATRAEAGQRTLLKRLQRYQRPD